MSRAGEETYSAEGLAEEEDMSWWKGSEWNFGRDGRDRKCDHLDCDDRANPEEAQQPTHKKMKTRTEKMRQCQRDSEAVPVGDGTFYIYIRELDEWHHFERSDRDLKLKFDDSGLKLIFAKNPDMVNAPEPTAQTPSASVPMPQVPMGPMGPMPPMPTLSGPPPLGPPPIGKHHQPQAVADVMVMRQQPQAVWDVAQPGPPPWKSPGGGPLPMPELAIPPMQRPWQVAQRPQLGGQGQADLVFPPWVVQVQTKVRSQTICQTGPVVKPSMPSQPASAQMQMQSGPSCVPRPPSIPPPQHLLLSPSSQRK